MIYLLDADVLTLAYFGKRGVRERVDAVRRPDVVMLAEVTRAEALNGRVQAVLKPADGATALQSFERLRATERLVDQFPVALFDAGAASHLDRLRAGKRTWKGRHPDLLLACTALTLAAILVTRNTKDFAGIPGLKVENWAD